MTRGSEPRYRPASDVLKGRVVLVTGAGAGIGRVGALAYARHGADVVLLGRTRSKLESVFDVIVAETATKPVIVPADLATLDEAAADNLAEAIREDYGRLDGILHNASVLGPRVPVAHYPADAWAEVMQVNAMAPVLLTRALLPLLEAAPKDFQQNLKSSQIIPRTRFGQPEEYAELCVHICENQLLNGDTIRLDAGTRMPPR